MITIWKKLFSNSPSTQPRKVSGKIEVFVRHCISSSISQHKKRFPHFSRELCHKNLLETIDLEKANLTFFLDTAKGSLEDHFLKQEKRFPIVEVKEGTEAGSFLRLLEHIEQRNLHPDTPIYLLEDDYLHRPNWTEVLLEGLRLADYATLYDHRDKYFFPMYEKLTSRIFVSKSCHWRTTPSTTNTFACTMKTLQKHLPVHRRFSQNRAITADHEKFCLLQKSGATLISPIPGWSTHAEPEFASPCIDWKSMIMSLKENPYVLR